MREMGTSKEIDGGKSSLIDNVKEWFSDHERVLTALGMVAVAVALFIAVTLAGCASPTTPVKTHKTYVVNSLWKVVKTVEVVDRSAREVVSNDVNAEVEAYNTVTLDDFLRVYTDQVPDIADAPPANVFIVNPVTYEVNMSATGITRQALIDDAPLWRSMSSDRGEILFIDHVPPPPIISPPASMYAQYALYVVDQNRAIVYEDHCGYLTDDTFTGQWITAPSNTTVNGVQGGGWATIDAYFYTIRNAFNSEVVKHSGWTLVEHQLYTAP